MNFSVPTFDAARVSAARQPVHVMVHESVLRVRENFTSHVCPFGTFPPYMHKRFNCPCLAMLTKRRRPSIWEHFRTCRSCPTPVARYRTGSTFERAVLRTVVKRHRIITVNAAKFSQVVKMRSGVVRRSLDTKRIGPYQMPGHLSTQIPQVMPEL